MTEPKKVAIVTGAANGIGEGLARDLIRQGYRVAIVDVNQEGGEALAKELGSDAKFFHCDVANYDSQAKMFQGVWDTWGRLDAVLANAGIVDRSSLYILTSKGKKEIPPAPDTACTDIVYKGTLYSTQLAVHFMRQNEKPGGKIVCTASIAGIYYHRNFPEYSGAKAAMIRFIACAAPIYKLKDKITINCVLPGMVPTPNIPKAMLAPFDPTWITPVSSVVTGYNKFLSDDTGITGQALELSGDKVFWVAQTPYQNGEISRRPCWAYEPMFKYLHGEYSELDDASY